MTTLLSSGFFFFAIDGLTESAVTAEMIREHVASSDGTVPLLIAGRPGGGHRAALTAGAARWIVVEPERLKGDAVNQFLAAYEVEKDHIPEKVLAACADADGSYSPLMLRLAVLVDDAAVETIRDLYQAAVGRVLEASGVELEAVLNLCLDTYWKTGDRHLPYAGQDNARKNLLSRLVQCDLLVPATLNRADPKGATPRTLRFFHDSVQSYLTAVAVMQGNDWRTGFQRASADPRFEPDDTGLTELAAMCVQVHASPTEMKRHLNDTLELIARERSGPLSRDTVVAASDLPSLGALLASEASAAEAVRKATRALEGDDTGPLGVFCARLLRLLPTPAIEHRHGPAGDSARPSTPGSGEDAMLVDASG